jgi:hypothetical protein
MDGIPAAAAALTAGFGAPRPTAVLAVLGYRIVSCWLSLGMGGLSSPPAEPETGWDRKPAAEFRGRPEAAAIRLLPADVGRACHSGIH